MIDFCYFRYEELNFLIRFEIDCQVFELEPPEEMAIFGDFGVSWAL